MAQQVIAPPRDKDLTRLFWHSERFKRLDFEIISNHSVIFGYSNGQMSVKLDRLKEFVEELQEVAEAYGGVE